MRFLRNLTLVSSLLGAALASTGCGTPREPVQVNWTFGGKTCLDAGIANIVVGLSGQTLVPDQFACQIGNNVTTGANLGTYYRGHYTLTITGFDSAGTAIYQGSTSIDVHRPSQAEISASGGDVFAIDVPAVAVVPGSGGSATLRWTFGGQGCAAAGVTLVHVTLDNQPLTDVHNSADLPCSQAVNGTQVDGIAVSPLPAGTHSFDIIGYVSGQASFQLNGLVVTVSDGRDTSVSPDVPAANVGSAQLSWTFVGMSCAEADVTTVQVFVDPNADGSGGTDAGTVPCTNSGVEGVAVSPLSPGNHSFAISGIRHAGGVDQLVYQTTHPASATFQAARSTAVPVVAVASSPGLGGVALTWLLPSDVTGCAGQNASIPVNYSLTAPGASAPQAPQTGSCGAGVLGVDFCWHGAPTAQCLGLAPGVWTVTASMSISGHTYSATGALFPVANSEHTAANIRFQ